MVCFSVIEIRFGHIVHMACSKPAPVRRQVDYVQLCLIFLQASESFDWFGRQWQHHLWPHYALVLKNSHDKSPPCVEFCRWFFVFFHGHVLILWQIVGLPDRPPSSDFFLVTIPWPSPTLLRFFGGRTNNIQRPLKFTKLCLFVEKWFIFIFFQTTPLWQVWTPDGWVQPQGLASV